MIARLQQLLMVSWVLLALGLMGFWWQRNPFIACLGFASLPLTYAAVLALEFLASWRVGAAARASASHYLRAWIAECRLAPRIFFWRQPFRWRAQLDHLPRNGLRGVVLLHGLMCNRGFWNPWLKVLRQRDRAFVAVNLEPIFGPIENYHAAIDAAVAQVTQATGLPPLMVCHSMGGLAARAWLLRTDPLRIHRVVTIGTPHGGTWIARFSRTTNGRQMRLGSAWLAQLDQSTDSARRALFVCWYSNTDNIVMPAVSASLGGAENRLAACLAHMEMAFDSTVLSETLSLLEEPTDAGSDAGACFSRRIFGNRIA